MKAHSERVANKNIKIFGGHPLYHHIAKVLQNSDYVEQIIINTDSDIIAEDATKHFSKVMILDRPKNLCGDFVPMNDIIAMISMRHHPNTFFRHIVRILY